MPTVTSKRQLLEDAGYDYVFDRMVYANRGAKKVFSVDFIDDHGEAEVADRIGAPTPEDGQWQFYFNSPPSESVKHQLTNILE